LKFAGQCDLLNSDFSLLFQFLYSSQCFRLLQIHGFLLLEFLPLCSDTVPLLHLPLLNSFLLSLFDLSLPPLFILNLLNLPLLLELLLDYRVFSDSMLLKLDQLFNIVALVPETVHSGVSFLLTKVPKGVHSSLTGKLFILFVYERVRKCFVCILTLIG